MSTKKKSTAHPVAAQNAPFSDALAMQAQVAATATHFQAQVLEQAAGYTFEIFDFLNERFGRDLKTARELGRCTSVEDAFRTLGAFHKQALTDYTIETARLSAKGSFTADALREEVAQDAEVLGRAVTGRAA